MPDHDTFDLDAAFTRLEQDVTSLSTAPGAGAAVARARRRRRTKLAEVAAAAVLVVGGLAVAQGLVHHDSAIEPSSSLPNPAPLDAAALSEATLGWTSAWSPSEGEGAQALVNGPFSRCLDQAPAAADPAEPVGGSGNQYFTSGAAASLAILVDYGNQTAQADTMWQQITSTVSGCGNATLSGQQVWDGAETVSYALSSPSGKTEHVWVAHTGSTIGILWIAKAPEPVPAPDDAAVATALVSALRSPASYQDVDSTGGSSSSGSVSSVSETGFARALAGWSSAWEQGSVNSEPPSASACDTDRWSSGSDSGAGSSLGANGDWEYYTFPSPAAAAGAADLLAQELRDCSQAAHALHSVATSGGEHVVVAVADGAQGTVWWIVQSGPDVGYIEIPASATPPPDSVSAAVGDLISRSITDNQASTQQGEGPAVSTSTVAPAE